MFKNLIIIEGKKHIELDNKNEVYNYLFGDNYINLSSEEKQDILKRNALIRTHNLDIDVTKELSCKDFCIYDEMTYIYSLLSLNYINLLENKYRKAYKEVRAVLGLFSKEDLDKIPQNIINAIEKNIDKNYNFVMNEFDESLLLDETKALLVIIYRDYFATNEEKEIMNKKFELDTKKAKDELSFNEDQNSFEIKYKRNKKELEKLEKISNLPIEVEKIKWYVKFINIIKRLFK